MDSSSNDSVAFQPTVVVVGAGMAGLYLIYRLRAAGISVVAIEAGDGVGGTWYWNRYPGARCDVPSMEYSYSFSEELEQEWEWTERYPTQPELLRYLNHVADRFDLRPYIRLSTRVTRAAFDSAGSRWHVETDRGDSFRPQFLIMATGCLSQPNRPDIAGFDRFAGEHYLTSRWPAEGVDLTGKRVGVIGTGSTGIQLIPQLARQAERVTVFQRTANFSIPARNAPLHPDDQQRTKQSYRSLRDLARQTPGGFSVSRSELAVDDVDADTRQAMLERGWQTGGPGHFMGAFNDVLVNPAANDIVADFARRKIHETVADPDVAARLTPTTHPIGTKRICIDIDYFETFNQTNVELVDLRSTPIETFTEAGLRTTAADFEFDIVIFATGFDAMTGALLAIDIIGRDGCRLRDVWAEGPQTYLGLAIPGFPNLFTVTGPQSPSVLTNMVVAIEQHVEWISDCLSWLRARAACEIEATVAACDEWVHHVNEVGAATLYPLADSWYVGANIPGKARTFMPYVGGLHNYRAKCDAIAANNYEGFEVR